MFSQVVGGIRLSERAAELQLFFLCLAEFREKSSGKLTYSD